MNARSEHTDKTKMSDSISVFILKHRIVLLAVLGVLVLGAVGTIVFVSVDQSVRTKGFAQLDAIESALTAENTEETAAEVAKIAAKNASNPVGSRAFLLLADIRFSQKKWDEAKTAYLAAAAANKKAYTAPICYYNAAVCSEELNDIPAALDLYARASASSNFPLAPRALFNMGRLEDGRENYESAVKYYDDASAKYPSDQWASLAKSRSLVLRAEGKVE